MVSESKKIIHLLRDRFSVLDHERFVASDEAL